MKRNALRKDFLMEIRKSLGRFLSICLIVLLGVSILVGIHATEPNMILSGDTYADEVKLMDIKVTDPKHRAETDPKHNAETDTVWILSFINCMIFDKSQSCIQLSCL